MAIKTLTHTNLGHNQTFTSNPSLPAGSELVSVRMRFVGRNKAGNTSSTLSAGGSTTAEEQVQTSGITFQNITKPTNSDFTSFTARAEQTVYVGGGGYGHNYSKSGYSVSSSAIVKAFGVIDLHSAATCQVMLIEDPGFNVYGPSNYTPSATPTAQMVQIVAIGYWSSKTTNPKLYRNTTKLTEYIGYLNAGSASGWYTLTGMVNGNNSLKAQLSSYDYVTDIEIEYTYNPPITNVPPTAPTLTFPIGGEVLNGTQTITWTMGTDADGDPLETKVEYGNGSTWETLATVEGASYVYDFSLKPDTTTAYIRVSHHDGTEYGPADTSDAFTISQSTGYYMMI
jgi:hypothetical protein